MTPNTDYGTRCAYCRNPCDGSLRDVYGEYVMRRALPICAECAGYFECEPGPWNEWNK